MTEQIALDTSVVIQIFRRDLNVAERIRRVETYWLPIPVIAEIRIGFLARKSSQAAQRAWKEFDSFVSSAKIIDCTWDVAARYADISLSLREKGLLIPQNDIWIAACCLVAGQPLATRDTHFQRVPDLDVEMW
jgi:predicted nucleic acid-binding protein